MRPGQSTTDDPSHSPLRVGIVGAGRARQGLGPYLAQWFERAGARIVGVSGRDPGGAARAAAELAPRLGHHVAAAADASELARTVDLLVVASPVAAHLDGLDAALAAGVHCLCEKPLVGWRDEAAGRARIAAFAARGRVLEENCQWPFVLPALFDAYPGAIGAPVQHLAMGLGPAGVGRSMVEDSLSHVLSVAQALGAAGPSTIAEGVRVSDRDAAAERMAVTFSLASPGATMAVELHLEHCPRQPRPAWLAVNGRRIDRRIGAGYELAFVDAAGRARKVPDPLERLVYGLVTTLQANPRERIAAIASSLDVRLRLYAAILRAVDSD